MDSIKIKLAVDRSRNRVLFADAGSDFVDVLLTFLTLPFSVLQFCAAGAWLPGCLSNLCDSVSRLRESKLLKVEACHGMLLTPSTAHEFGEDNFCLNNDEFVKSQPNLQVDGEFCTCWLVMARLMCVYREATSSSHGKFVRCKERFVISDDCTIKPASTTAMRSLTHSFDSGAILHDFEEVEVCVSWAEVVSMLKACFSSETILTDVFLLMDTHVTVKLPGTNQKILVTPNDDSVILSEFHTRLFYDMKEKKVMYAECRHELVDLLLGFLTYPLGHVIKNMLTSPLGIGGFHNLYMSAVKLDEAGFITGGHPTETLLNPALSPFCRRPECSTLKEDLVEPENLFMGLVSYGSCSGCRNDLVEDRKYVVGDDLVVHQASAMSVMKHWCGRDNANVVEMDITITKEEAVLLLRAMYTSKTPLTDVFISRLEEHSSLQKMQISVKIPTGKIGSVEVSRFDTIATVKSRIEEKVPIPAGRRHELVYGSKTLEDSCTAADYNLVSKCTITCKFRRANDYEDYEPLV